MPNEEADHGFSYVWVYFRGSFVLTMKAIKKRVIQSIFTCGIDEAGRGALAGPVAAGACILPKLRKFPVRIMDSKQMSPSDREESFEWLMSNAICGIGVVDASEIDRIGILAATEIAMQKAVAQVSAVHPDLYLLVDGRDAFWFDHPHSSVVRGDQSEPCIAAASILAKVTRDRWMIDLDKALPAYGFAEHKGYGTPAHIEAIRHSGVSAEHRTTFLRNVMG